MNTVSEALNTLVTAVNIAYNKGGVYSMEETHHIYTAIAYLNSLSKETPAPAPTPEQVAPQTMEEEFHEEIHEDIEDVQNAQDNQRY